jgi:tubulin-specific chaperone A
MSHELRTPLNSILLLSRYLADNKDSSLTEDHVESVKSIHSSGSDLLDLINEVLDLSKVEAGKMEINLGDMDINDFASTMKRNFQPLAAEKKLALNIDIEEGFPAHIHTDRQRVEQVVKNFLSNAFKFTDKGSITLRIGRPGPSEHIKVGPQKTGFDPAKTVAFSVTDTGLGIPEKKQKLIFEAFQQADGTTSRKYGGTGLGLSIAREFAHLLGGDVCMGSTYGKGSVFILNLPESFESGELEVETGKLKLETKDVGPSTSQQEVSDKRKEAFEDIEDDRKTTTPEDKSILVIEDDFIFLKILRDLTREHGFKCLVAGDGETGLQLADYYKPKAIILDVGLPGINGWAVMTRLKDNPETRHIPVHFISATDKKTEAMRMGAIDYLIKPVSPEDLSHMCEKLDKIISKPVKELLVVEDNKEQAKTIVKMLGNGDIQTTVVSTAKEAYDQLLSGKFDCMVLDLRLPDISGIELLKKVKSSQDICHIPIIVYTGKELTKQEKAVVDEYSESTIIKGVNSHQKLLDETTLFLHRVETNLPKAQQKLLKMMHDKEEIFVNKKILVVDDDMRNVFSLKKVLEGKGMSVLVGKNGKDGLECLNNHPDIDLVLMDIMMPEMDGYEAMEEIRKQKRFKKLPIVTLTAKAMKGDRAKCIEAGASDYLAKPVDTDRLFSMLRVWLY